MYRRALPLLAVALAQLALVGWAALKDPQPRTVAQKRAERADVGGPFPLELRSPQVVAGTSQRVLIALRRPSLARAADEPRDAAAQRAYVRSLNREAEALMSALDAKGVRFGRPVLYARVWSGFAATLATKDLPAVQALGLRVEPVSRFYPAQVPAADAPAVEALPTTAGGRSRIAVIDAFPRRSKLDADEVGRAGSGRLSAPERAGERSAAVIRDELPRAQLARIRAAGAQPLENGKFQVFATTDQLLAALERAVDPDGDGDTTDGSDVAMVGVSAPYSGFDRSPAAEAAGAATRLGTLVVAPAGNGGDPEGPFGSIGSPGAGGGVLTVGALDASGDPAEGSSRGPTYGMRSKPDLAIGGGAETDAGTAWGTAIAAARVAGVAAALRAERPELTAEEAAGALIGTAAPRGDAFEAGGGDPLLQAARNAPIAARPHSFAIRPAGRITIRIDALGDAAPPTLDPSRPDGLDIRVDGDLVRIRAHGDAETGSGRIDLGPIAIPFTIVDEQAPTPPLGRLRVLTRGGEPDGVRFTAGSIERGDSGTGVVPIGNLELVLSGPTRRSLTPVGGARNLLPGDYAYTLTAEIKRSLEPGRYRFVAHARGTAGGQVVERSTPFRIP